MAMVFYSGLNREGNHFRRFEEVEDVDDLFDLADRNDEDILKIIRLPSIPGLSSIKFSESPKDKDVVEFCRQLSMYLEGGVDIRQIFEDIHNELGSPVLRKIVKKVAARLAEGESLSSAFRIIRAMPDVVVTLVEIGEKSGHLAQSLKDAANYLEREIELRSSTVRALIYPMFTISIMFVALVFWIAYVIPQIVNVIKLMDVELPVQTRILLSVSEFMQDYWLSELVVLFTIVGGILLARGIPRFRYYLDKLWWHMPVFGGLVVSSQMAFYFNYFRVLYDAGIPLIEILVRMQRSIPSLYFRKAVEKSNDVVMEGNSLQTGYQHAKLFESVAIRIIGVGEQTGSLQKQLNILGDIYMKRVKQFVETLPKVLEPVFIIIIGLFFALFASTLLGPLYEVIVKVAGKS